MATSRNRPFLKLFRENQSDEIIRGAGKGGRSRKSSYQRYKSGFYGSRKGRNNFKILIGKKRKEEVDVGDDTDKVDAKTVEEIVVRQPSFGSDAFNESFVRFLNEKYGEGGEVSNSEPVENKRGKIVIVNDNDEEMFEVLEVPETFDKNRKNI